MGDAVAHLPAKVIPLFEPSLPGILSEPPFPFPKRGGGATVIEGVSAKADRRAQARDAFGRDLQAPVGYLGFR